MKWALIALGVVVGLIALAAVIGLLIPKGHVASRTARYRQKPEAVWEAITDTEAMLSWRTDLKSVERLPDDGGMPVRRENAGGMVMTLKTIESAPPRRLVQRIMDKDLPFGGTWTYEIASTAEGCSLTITENGEIYNPIFRFMAKAIFGYTSTMEKFLKNLGAKFGQEVDVVE